MDRRDHYATLGVPRDASATQIRDAYRKLARQYHPDLHPEDTAAEEVLKRVNEAYEVLSDADKRRKYHLLGTEWDAILRDEDALRRETGFAPVAEAVASAAAAASRNARVFRDRTDSYLALANIARVAIVGFVLAGFALVAPYGWRSRGPAVQPRPALNIYETAASMRDLSGALYRFAEILDEGVEVWRRVCVERSMQTDDFLDRTVKPNYQRRYRRDAEAVITQITRAESAGAFTLRLTASDQAVLRSLLSLRDELRETTGTSPLDCRNDLPVREFKSLAKRATAGRRCLDQLSQLPSARLAAQDNARQDVCEGSAGSG